MVDIKAQLVLLAEYNTWMNKQLYQAASTLAPEVLLADKKAFFGSITGSFNHIVIADLIWLRRFSNHSSLFSLTEALSTFSVPQSLDQILYSDFAELTAKRLELDQIIEQWTAQLEVNTLEQSLSYHNMKGIPQCKKMLSLLMHFFTHQIHHRGQITTLLSQENVDFGETDLLLSIPNEPMI